MFSTIKHVTHKIAQAFRSARASWVLFALWWGYLTAAFVAFLGNEKFFISFLVLVVALCTALNFLRRMLIERERNNGVD